jgi:hypothetical protein
MTRFASAFIALGVDDSINTCDCCGKKNIKCTVALETVSTGEIVHFGRDCAGAVLFGRKTRQNGEAAQKQARRNAKAAPVVAFVKGGFDAGRRDVELVAEAEKLARAVNADLSVYRTRIGGRDNDMTPTAYEVSWTGGRVRFEFEGTAALIAAHTKKAA